MKRVVLASLPLAALLFTQGARAQWAGPTGGERSSGANPTEAPQAPQVPKDKPVETEAPAAPPKPKEPLIWRGSSILVDQSMSTQTAGLEPTPQQSYLPYYQWWVSLRPRIAISKKLSYSARFDYYKEFTNTRASRYYREDWFGDIWNTLGYRTPLAKEGALKRTSVGISGNIILPTSRTSQASGIYTIVGAGVNLGQGIELGGAKATAFKSMNVSLTSSYSHPFSRSTVSDGLERPVYRQDLNGRSLPSTDIGGSMQSNHRLMLGVSAGVQILEKLSWDASFNVSNGWNYAPRDDVYVDITSGPTYVPPDETAMLFSQQMGVSTSVSYSLFDELSLTLGYTNMSGTLSPASERRGLYGPENIWWSPQARVSFSVTLHLDKFYETITGSGSKEGDGHGPAPMRGNPNAPVNQVSKSAPDPFGMGAGGMGLPMQGLGSVL